MNKLSLYTTTIVLSALSFSGLAQKSDASIGSEVVNVIGTYTPTISDAFKVKETPSFDDETITNKEEINYSISSFPVASTFTPEKGSAASVERARREKYFNNYASIGIGNYGTLLGELFLTHNISKNQYIGGMVKHHSSQGGIKDVVLDDFFYDTSVDLTYAAQEDDYSWNADLGYRNQVYNWYGLPVDFITFDDETIKTIDEQQTYHSFYLGGKLSMNESVFNDVEVYYKRFWDAQSSSENRFWLKPGFDIDFNQTRVKFDVVADYVGTAFERDYENTIDLEYSYFNLGVQPSIVYQVDELSLKAGAGLFYSLGKAMDETENNFYIYPQIQASYRVVGDLMIAYAGAEGTLQQNSYADFAGENPFVSPTIGIAPTDRQYDIYVGLKGKLASNVAYNIRGSFMNEKGKALFASAYNADNTNTEGYAFGNSFYVLYDDVKTFGFFGEIKTDISKKFSVNLSGNFNGYSTDREAEAWYLPSIRISAGANADITDKLSINTNIFYVGERKALASYQTDPLMPVMPSEVTLDGYVDVNLGMNYKFNERLSLFLKAYNLADKKYEKWLNFPVQGIQVLAGASYKFDF